MIPKQKANLVYAAIFFVVLSPRIHADDARKNERLDRPAINALIDSLANKNKEPLMVKVSTSIGAERNPLFSGDYDWKEDDRIVQMANKISQQDSEDLWWSLISHLEDKRYAIAYGYDGEAQIESIGDLCWMKAMYDVQWFYTRFAPRSFLDDRPLTPLIVIRSPSEMQNWFRNHKDVPLYKQQIELAEQALKKFDKELPSIEQYQHMSDTEKDNYISNVKKQIATLEETKSPILGHRPLLSGGCEFYNANFADEIRDKYQKAKKTNGKQ